jgi:hypothetical protein
MHQESCFLPMEIHIVGTCGNARARALNWEITAVETTMAEFEKESVRSELGDRYKQ